MVVKLTGMNGAIALTLAGALLGSCASTVPARCEDGPFDCPAEWAAWPMRTTAAPYTTSADTATEPGSGLMWQRVIPKEMQPWSSAKSYYEELELGGHDDWRLPSRLELLTLVDYPTGDGPQESSSAAAPFGQPLIDRAAFANTPPAPFWTASNFVEDESTLSSAWPGDDVAWTVDFRTGLVEQEHVELLLPRTRCVRNARPPAASTAGRRYTVNADTVSETATGLIWERTLVQRTYEQAQQHCAELVLGGTGGFRLPHVKEAMTIASALYDALGEPCLDPEAFKLTGSYFYGGLWTSTPWTGDAQSPIGDGDRLTVNLSARGKLSSADTSGGVTGPPTEATLCVRAASAPRTPGLEEERR